MAIDLRESREKVAAYLKKQNPSYINLIDQTGEISAVYGVQSTPVKFIIDKNGNMVSAALGYREWDSKEMHDLFDILIEQ